MTLCCQGYITVGYRGTFAIGRGDMSTTGFRKLGRILVCGKSALCREVFKVGMVGREKEALSDCRCLQDTLNESRDPDRGLDGDRYTSRYFLKHSSLEQAFDQLCASGFRMVRLSRDCLLVTVDCVNITITRWAAVPVAPALIIILEIWSQDRSVNNPDITTSSRLHISLIIFYIKQLQWTKKFVQFEREKILQLVSRVSAVCGKLPQ